MDQMSDEMIVKKIKIGHMTVSAGRPVFTDAGRLHEIEAGYAERAGEPQDRASLRNISAYLDKAYQQKLRYMKALGHGDAQLLIAEALDDLFEKHGITSASMAAKLNREA
jgi:hypothetical protein